MCPGSKDYVIMRNSDGEKVKHQKRYMLMTLKEAHHFFSEQHSEVKCGISKFCSLRPSYVKYLSDVPHTTCTCKYHENVRMLLKTLSKTGETLATVPTEFRSFLNIVIKKVNYVCWTIVKVV